MNIGIICYASVGGSGIVATELAKSLAVRGHADFELRALHHCAAISTAALRASAISPSRPRTL